MSTAETERGALKTSKIRTDGYGVRQPRRIRISRVSMYILAIVIALVVVFPVYWAVRTSVLPSKILFTDTGFIPKTISSDSYLYVLTKTAVPLGMWNSFKVGVFTIALSLFVSSLAAFRFSRGRFPGQRALFFLFLGTIWFRFTS